MQRFTLAIISLSFYIAALAKACADQIVGATVIVVDKALNYASIAASWLATKAEAAQVRLAAAK